MLKLKKSKTNSTKTMFSIGQGNTFKIFILFIRMVFGRKKDAIFYL